MAKKSSSNGTRKTTAASKKQATKNRVSTKKTPAKKAPAKKKVDSVSTAIEKASEARNSSLKASGPSGFPIVGIGASAGGLEAFESFFKAMPSDSGMGFVLVAHLDPTHISILPELLQKRTSMPVCQVKDLMEVLPNHVYVIPPNKDLTILNGTLHLMDLSQPRGVNLPIDTFLRSLAQDQERKAVCVILSGTGTDGTLGVKAIKGEVGMVMVQDEESSKYDGMPRSAISTGLVDYVLPPDQMPRQLIKYTKHARHRATARIAPAEGPIPSALQKIFVLLRARTNHDFSLYKKNTICRRIERRMNVHQIDDIADYVRYLQGSDREASILFKELLIGVTNFFRDKEVFETLQERTLPKLLAGKPDDSAIRVWVPGCASGEEAYSISIALHECMEKMGRHFHVQIFATDIDEDAIAVARAGVYPESIMVDVGPERIKRYFVKEDNGQFRVKKMIRETLVFAPQNVIKDPPFTKLDMLSCRNLLIYLGPELQKRLLPIFHYSIKPDGVLLLGSSETIGQHTDLFAITEKKWKIFRRKPTSTAARAMLDFPAFPAIMEARELAAPATVQRAEELSALQLVETILQQSNAAPCAIVNDACNVVYIHGRTGRFLEPAEGKASVNIVEMARPGIKTELASAIRQVSTNKQEVVHKGLTIQHNGDKLFVNLTVKPILEQVVMRGLMMVIFEETEVQAAIGRSKPKSKIVKSAKKSIVELEQELQYSRENLQTTIEELETSNEELKSTNEELQSTNEELQSTNEELETSKEELQSLNEESATVNSELQARIDELSHANDDMKNLLDSTEIATVFLDAELRIRRFTPKATELIPLTASDSGRPIQHLASDLDNIDLAKYGKQVLKDLAVQEHEVTASGGRTFVMRIRPYRTVTNVIDGVVITFEDVTSLKSTAEALRASELRSRSLLDCSSVCFKIIDLQSRLRYMSAAGKKQLKIRDVESLYGTSYPPELYPDEARSKLIDCLKRAKKGETCTTECLVFDTEGGEVWYHTTFGPTYDEAGELKYIISTSVEITARKQAEDALRESEEEHRLLVENSPYCIHQIGLDGRLVSMNAAGLAILEADEKSVIGTAYMDFVSAADKARVEGLMANAINGGSFEFDFIAANGQSYFSSFIPIRDNNGLVIRLMGITHPVTNAKRS